MNGFSYYREHSYIQDMTTIILSKINKLVYFYIKSIKSINFIFNGINNNIEGNSSIILNLTLLDNNDIIEELLHNISKCIYLFFNKRYIYFQFNYTDTFLKELILIRKMLTLDFSITIL